MANTATVDAGRNLDKRLMLWLGGLVLLIIVAVSLFAPSPANNDPRPSTYNTAPGGAKAAYLMLTSMGWPVARWDQPLDDLAGVDAAHTTLLLAAPNFTALEKDRLAAAVQDFLKRGGRVVTTGPQGALLLPGGAVAGSRRLSSLCYTQPAGPGALARAGEVEMQDVARWDGKGPGVIVEQRCGPDAVVVRIPVGSGEAVWWSSPGPLTNAELHRDTDLRLFLAALGDGRRVLFDESLQQVTRTQWRAARGLPLFWLLAQFLLLFGLLVFSFSRRRGPIRLPEGVPRSSPVEFAVNMGDLYERAGATAAATEAARRRLLRVLVYEAGLSQGTINSGASGIVAALEARFGSSWKSLGDHLEEATEAADLQLRAGSALRLVRALGQDAERVRRAAGPQRKAEASLAQQAELTSTA